MRRTDRELSSHQEILAVLNRCDVIRLGINTLDYPYVVPMNFGLYNEGEFLTLWFHCAKDGYKLDLIRQNPRVGFEADCAHRLVLDDKACSSTMEYESVTGYGNMSICSDRADKQRGLEAIMRHYAPESAFDFADSDLSSVCILRLDVLHITGKSLKKSQPYLNIP